jgi:hypothetical protein
MEKTIKAILVALILSVSIKANAQWEPDVRLTYNVVTSGTSVNNAWCVAGSGDIVHVVWYSNDEGNYEIYYNRSTNAGINWGADVRLTNDTTTSYYPSIAVNGTTVHVVWQDSRNGSKEEIYYKRSTNSGVSWGEDVRLTYNYEISNYPSLAVSGSAVHLVWQDFRDGSGGEIYYKCSTNAGVSWGEDMRLTNCPSYLSCPSVTVNGQTVHVVWTDFRDGPAGEIYYKCSTNSGVNWGADTRLTDLPGESKFASVAVSGPAVHVVWTDFRDGNYEIYYKRSTDAGVSWGADTRLTNNIEWSRLPSVSVSGTVVHVVWIDNRDDLEYEIYYKRSTDAGLTWGADTRLTNTNGESLNPSVAVSGSAVHVVWTDQPEYWYYEVYYKRNPTGNITGIINISSEIPLTYSLEQNYPNPFNPVTRIQYDLPRAGVVKLVVYDVMGREVEMLVNERQVAGSYEATFDGSRFASGVYFYRLTAEEYGETRKMLLVR